MVETKHDKFKRLARLRGERVLRDLQLIQNLSNRRNYEYTDEDVKALFGTIEQELRLAKISFSKSEKRKIIL